MRQTLDFELNGLGECAYTTGICGRASWSHCFCKIIANPATSVRQSANSGTVQKPWNDANSSSRRRKSVEHMDSFFLDCQRVQTQSNAMVALHLPTLIQYSGAESHQTLQCSRRMLNHPAENHSVLRSPVEFSLRAAFLTKRLKNQAEFSLVNKNTCRIFPKGIFHRSLVASASILHALSRPFRCV